MTLHTQHPLQGMGWDWCSATGALQLRQRGTPISQVTVCAGRLGGEHNSGVCQPPVSGEHSHRPPALQPMLLDSQMTLLFTYSLSTFQTAVISLGLRVNETAWKPFNRVLSISYSMLGPLSVSIIDFLSQAF